MIEIGRGNPAVEAVPYQELGRAARRVSQQYPEALNQYLAPEGFAPLRQVLAEKFGGQDVRQVILGNGSIELLANACRVLHEMAPAAVALMEQPSYDLAVEILPKEAGRVIGVPVRMDGLDLDALEQLTVEERVGFLYTIPDFQNPTGISLALEKRHRLVELARSRGFWIIEDAAYRELRYRGQACPTLYQLAPDRVLHLGSFSKTVAPGLRVGFLVGDGEILAAVANSARQRRLFPNTFSQALIHSLLTSGMYALHVAQLRGMYSERLGLLLEQLQAELPSAVRWSAVEGGFFVGLFCPRPAPSNSFAETARGFDLSLLDGDAFFLRPDPHQFFVRLAFPKLSLEDIRRVAVRLGNCYRSYTKSPQLGLD